MQKKQTLLIKPPANGGGEGKKKGRGTYLPSPVVLNFDLFGINFRDSGINFLHPRSSGKFNFCCDAGASQVLKPACNNHGPHLYIVATRTPGWGRVAVRTYIFICICFALSMRSRRWGRGTARIKTSAHAGTPESCRLLLFNGCNASA